jgi:hypothetical protein
MAAITGDVKAAKLLLESRLLESRKKRSKSKAEMELAVSRKVGKSSGVQVAIANKLKEAEKDGSTIGLPICKVRRIACRKEGEILVG